MKRIIFLFFALLPMLAFGQRLETIMPPPSEVAKEYRPTYRKLLRADEVRRETLEAQGYEIILPEEEQVPIYISIASAQNQTNWGRDALAAGIAGRLATECIYPVIVKVTDTGGKLSHPDLQTGQLTGSTYTGEATIDDVNGHATHCAGIIAAQGLGLAWPLVSSGKVKFKPIEVLTDGGGGSFTWVQNAYASERAEDVKYKGQGIAVVYSGSFGGGTAIVAPVEAEIEKTIAAGIYMFFANGNTGGPVNYPAMSPLALSIASLDQSMVASSYSSRGPETDIAMPGRNINSTFRGGTYAVLSGTSMATPFAAAVGAIALSKWGMAKLPNQAALTAYLTKIATDIPPAGRDDATGYGVVFVQKILDTAPDGGTPPPPPPPPPPVDPPAPAPVVQVVTNVTTGYAIRYRFAGQVADNILHIKRVTLYADGKTAEESIENARTACARYFPTHVIAEIPAKDGLQGAGYWAGQFLEYYGKNNAMPLQVESIEVADELGRSFIVTGFDRAELPASYDSTLPRLLILGGIPGTSATIKK
jgi:hypothetical protein